MLVRDACLCESYACKRYMSVRDADARLLLRVGRVSVTTRWFVQVQLGKPQVARLPQASR